MEKIIASFPAHIQDLVPKMHAHNEMLLEANEPQYSHVFEGFRMLPYFPEETARYAKYEWADIREDDIFIVSYPKCGKETCIGLHTAVAYICIY